MFIPNLVCSVSFASFTLTRLSSFRSALAMCVRVRAAIWESRLRPSSISLRSIGGPEPATRVTLVWPDGAIQKQWLEVTVKATTRTGLAADDVFYFGNAVAESGISEYDL